MREQGTNKADWSERLRKAVNTDGRSIYALAKAAEMDDAHLRRWLRGDCGLSLEIANRLGVALGFDLVAQLKRAKK